MCLPLSDFVLTSGSDRQHISSNSLALAWVFLLLQSSTYTHTQLCTHKMTKELWIKNFCPQKVAFSFVHSWFACLSDCVCFSGFTELSSTMLSKATLPLVFLFYEQPNYQFRNSPLPFLLILDVRPVHQQPPGSCGEPPHTSASIDSKYDWVCRV